MPRPKPLRPLFVGTLVAAGVTVYWVSTCHAQTRMKPPPTQQNVKYGPHERNVLDFWQATSDEPTPLVLYIHGGGFRAGSKDSLNARTLRELLDARISVAGINYRLITQAPLPAAHEDCLRALQFLRWKAGEWNIDSDRVGAFGGSAGAQLCMYLAFHDEMADPESDDLLARQSSRLTCVATNGGQTTMDLAWWKEHIPGYEAAHRNFFETFGVDTQQEYMQHVKNVSALSLLSKDDPPIFMTYRMAPDERVPEGAQTARGWKVHHVMFGVKLKEKMDALGIEADLKYPGAETAYRSVPHFFIEKLTHEQQPKNTENQPESPRQGVVRRFLEAAPRIGEDLPEVSAYDAAGQMVNLRSLKGHYTVLVFGCLT